MAKCRLCFLPVFLFAASSIALQPGPFQPQPHDWPQWQGPERNNRSRETGLLPAWPPAGPPLVWKAKGLGGGYSAPSIAAGRAFGMSYRGNDEVVWALNAQDGKELWQRKIAVANRRVDYDEGSRCTPTVDGDRLYALGVSGDLVCLQVADGKQIWRKNLIRDFGGTLPYYRASYGYAESPLIDGDRVVVTPGEPKHTLVALDKRTGKLLLSASVPEGAKKGSSRAEYASVATAEVAGRKQYVVFLHGGLAGIAADDGRLLWRYDKPSSGIVNCNTPIIADGLVFAASGYGKGGGLARLADRQQGQAEEVYFTKRMKNLHGGMVLVDGWLYGGSEPGMLVCLDFRTGKGGWDERRPGKGSIAYADGHLYYRNERGPMLLIEATPKAYVEKARFDPPDRSRHHAWSHPVIANGRLYLRDQDVLLCYDVKQRQ
ncbi:MAG TPA: PQQ-binding-like beta-propeller repeat protein [Gemmataceae bacterium]|nr:PQQ-binding-like beta-propeller repeat protein [Gemmataceae bacterium]